MPKSANDALQLPVSQMTQYLREGLDKAKATEPEDVRRVTLTLNARNSYLLEGHTKASGMSLSYWIDLMILKDTEAIQRLWKRALADRAAGSDAAHG